MSAFPQDLAYALRQLRRGAGSTTMARLTLALGIGATTAIFSVADVALRRPLRYPEADRWRSAPNDRTFIRTRPRSAARE